MPISTKETIIIVIVAAVCTFATRLVPFVLFSGRKEPPKFVNYLGSVLPVAIIGVLIVYGIGDVRDMGLNGLLPKLIAVAVTALLHFWKRNTLLSIAVGTIGYMLLINFVFK